MACPTGPTTSAASRSPEIVAGGRGTSWRSGGRVCDRRIVRAEPEHDAAVREPLADVNMRLRHVTFEAFIGELATPDSGPVESSSIFPGEPPRGIRDHGGHFVVGRQHWRAAGGADLWLSSSAVATVVMPRPTAAIAAINAAVTLVTRSIGASSHVRETRIS